MKYLFAGFLFLTLTACSTSSKKESSVVVPEPSPVSESRTPSIDYEGLQKHLGLAQDREELGYKEKIFNTCEVGYGFPSGSQCHREQFVVIQFRLLCRDSEGTISTVLTDEDLKPLERRSVRWNLKGIQGTTYTDNDGYGQIVTTSMQSQKGQRLRLAIGNEFLYMRSHEIKKVITPHPWCNQY